MDVVRGLVMILMAIIVAHPALYALMGAAHATQGGVLDSLFNVLYLGDGFSIGSGEPPRLVQFVENAKGRVARILETFGRVPLRYYVLHIPLIHLAAVAVVAVVSLIRTGAVSAWLFANHPLNPGPQPEGAEWSLPLLILVWAIVVVLLYFPCRWFASVRRRTNHTLLSYL